MLKRITDFLAGASSAGGGGYVFWEMVQPANAIGGLAIYPASVYSFVALAVGVYLIVRAFFEDDKPTDSRN